MLASIVLAILVGQATGSQPPAQAAPEAPWPPAGVSRPGAEVTTPRVIKEVRPIYTASARRERIQGTILLEAIVQADGTVGEVRVRRSLDREFGLDDEAVKALKQWRFAPGTKDKVAVPVLVEVEITFTLK